MKKLFFALPLLAMAFILGRCAGDLTGEAGPAGSDALSSPTLTIRGGGKISWDADLDKASFSDDIIIYDHQAGSTITISASASHVTLDQEDYVAYVARNTVGGSETELTKIDVAPLDEVSAGESSETAIVLFHRTDEETLWLPWVQKELLTGDFWQFGVALSWYERVATAKKPGYRNNGSNTTHVVVPASSENPAVLSIDGRLHVNTSDEPCDLAGGSQRGGLDEDSTLKSNTPYYLYGIPSENSRTFDVVASETDPGTGPSGYEAWSYIGATATDTPSTINVTPFESRGGVYIANDEIDEARHSTNAICNADTTAVQRTWASAPITANQFYMWLLVKPTDASAVGYRVRVSGISTVPTDQALSQAGQNLDLFTEAYGWVPVLDKQRAWIRCDHKDINVEVYLMGWKEDPMAYK